MYITGDVVIDTVKNIWETTLGLQVRLSPAIFFNTEKYNWVKAEVDIVSEAWTGAVEVLCSRGMAQRAAAIMFRQPAQGISEDQLKDTVGELANITAGNVKQALPDLSTLTLPSADVVEAAQVVHPKGQLIKSMSFYCDNDIFSISIFQLK